MWGSVEEKQILFGDDRKNGNDNKRI